MRRLLILGAGTAGTIAANKLRRRLATRDWTITVIDRGRVHLYQPGLLFVPFGRAGSENLIRPHDRHLRRRITLVHGEIDRVVPHTHHVTLVDRRRFDFDYLVIATGSIPRHDGTPGLVGPQWRRTVHEFSTLTGAIALRTALHRLSRTGGRLVVHVADGPLKHPAVPLEFTLLADTYLRRLGVRDADVVYATAREFGEPGVADRLAALLHDREIVLEAGFRARRVDCDRRILVGDDGREIPFDLLVTVPANTGPDYIGRSGLGDDHNFVPVDRDTLRSTAHSDIFALGEAADLPDTMTNSAARRSAHVFAENFVRLAAGLPMTASFQRYTQRADGAGRTTRAAEWLYWHVLLPGRPLPDTTTVIGAGDVAAAQLALLPAARTAGGNDHPDADELRRTEGSAWVP